MARRKKEKLDLDATRELTHSPFGALGDRFGIAPSPVSAPEETEAVPEETSQQAMLLIRKEKRKGGKAVTCIYHIAHDHKAWLKKMKQRFATGGTVDDGVLALQGDLRAQVSAWLEEQGFRCRLGN